MSKTFVLRKPIESDGARLEKLEVRDITTADYISLGPVSVVSINPDASSYVKELSNVMVLYIVRLTGLTASEVRKLDLRDYFEIADYIKSTLTFISEPDSET